MNTIKRFGHWITITNSGAYSIDQSFTRSIIKALLMRQSHQDIILTRTPKDAPNPNTREAAEKRRQTINEQIDEFFAKGGKITKVPSFGEGEK